MSTHSCALCLACSIPAQHTQHRPCSGVCSLGTTPARREDIWRPPLAPNERVAGVRSIIRDNGTVEACRGMGRGGTAPVLVPSSYFAPFGPSARGGGPVPRGVPPAGGAAREEPEPRGPLRAPRARPADGQPALTRLPRPGSARAAREALPLAQHSEPWARNKHNMYIYTCVWMNV